MKKYIKGEVGTIYMFKLSSNRFYWPFQGSAFLWIIFVVCLCLCCAVLSVFSCLVVTFWERADLLAILRVMHSCLFVTFSYIVS